MLRVLDMYSASEVSRIEIKVYEMATVNLTC